jgi:hypothetical protein
MRFALHILCFLVLLALGAQVTAPASAAVSADDCTVAGTMVNDCGGSFDMSKPSCDDYGLHCAPAQLCDTAAQRFDLSGTDEALRVGDLPPSLLHAPPPGPPKPAS